MTRYGRRAPSKSSDLNGIREQQRFGIQMVQDVFPFKILFLEKQLSNIAEESLY
jgi:hypothetical protein